MQPIFSASAVVAVVTTLLAVTRANAFHALLYLIVSLLAVALVLFSLGAPFAAALEAIVYAGAIMVLNLGQAAERQERAWLAPGIWRGPGLLAVVLAGLLAYAIARGAVGATGGGTVGADAVGLALFGPYLLAVELASMLLLAGLVGAYHLGRDLMGPDLMGPDLMGRDLPGRDWAGEDGP